MPSIRETETDVLLDVAAAIGITIEQMNSDFRVVDYSKSQEWLFGADRPAREGFIDPRVLPEDVAR